MGIGGTPAYDSDGDVMEYLNIQANAALARTWLNGGVMGTDINADAVLRDHIVRPDFFGFPTEGMVGRLQHVYGFGENNNGIVPGEGTDDGARAWAMRRDRETIIPFRTNIGEIWRTRIGKTFYAPSAGFIHANCQGIVRASHINTTTYPDSEGVGHRGGRLVLAYNRRTHPDVRDVEVSYSRFYLYPEIRDQFDCSAIITVSGPGVWDVYLGYVRGSVTAANNAYFQYDLRTINFNIELAFGV